MHPDQFVIYHDNGKAVSETINAAINKNNLVFLCKALSILERGRWQVYRMGEICPLIKEWKMAVLFLSKHYLLLR